jgi:hypothetical protein
MVESQTDSLDSYLRAPTIALGCVRGRRRRTHQLSAGQNRNRSDYESGKRNEAAWWSQLVTLRVSLFLP